METQFIKIYNIDSVNIFFNQMKFTQSEETMLKFCEYHTHDILINFMGLFPPPSIWELWNRWNK